MFVLSIGTFALIAFSIIGISVIIGKYIGEELFPMFVCFILLLLLAVSLFIVKEYPVGIDEKSEIIVESSLDLLYDTVKKFYIVVLENEEEYILNEIDVDDEQYEFLLDNNDYTLVINFLSYYDIGLFKFKSYSNILFLNNDIFDEYQQKDERRKFIMEFN